MVLYLYNKIFGDNDILWKWNAGTSQQLKKKKMLVGKELMYSAIYCKIVSKQY